MSTQPVAPAHSRRRWLLLPAVVVLAAAALFLLLPTKGEMRAQEEPAPALPELDGVAWLNTAAPIKLKDLKGKVVVLDFWTLCCINCIHTLPDLAKLEKKYANELVVIGVHSPKFDNEKETQSIRKAVLRYEISHPVVNDAEMKIWRSFDVSSWPTLVVIGPDGRYLGSISGEGHLELLDKVIGKLVKEAKEKKILNEKPMRFDLARNREGGDTPLYFPGKVFADAKSKRLFIADSTHHRIVVTDMAGNKLAVIGAGAPGNKDGSFEEARFDDPQGMALKDEVLYIADRKNHQLRAADLKARTVKRVAGTGVQNRDRDNGGPALEVGLNSPWDLLIDGDRMFIAMAGHHQIWTMDLKKNTLEPYAGDGRENIKDGQLFAAGAEQPGAQARFAQPSGLTTDGKNLYVADSEVSAIRKVPMKGDGRVTTLVGEGLFEFGDIDGVGNDARIQHALGVAFHDGLVYVADTYNSKIKTIDPNSRECKTFIGGPTKNEWFTGPLFNEPAGISYADGKLYVADTNSHRIRVVDLKTKAVTTLPLKGVEPPVPVKE